MSRIVSQVLASFEFIDRRKILSTVPQPPEAGESKRYLTLGRCALLCEEQIISVEPRGPRSDDLAAGAGGGEARVIPSG